MCLPVELRLLAVVKGLPSCFYSFRHTTWHLRAVRIPLPVPNTILHVQSSAWTHNQYKHVEWEQAFTFPATLLSFQNIHLSRTISAHFSKHSSLKSRFGLFLALSRFSIFGFCRELNPFSPFFESFPEITTSSKQPYSLTVNCFRSFDWHRGKNFKRFLLDFCSD